MQDGVIVQEGRPWDIYTQPNSTYVAQFLGKANLVQGSVVVASLEDGITFESALGSLRCAVRDETQPATGPALLACRPESISLHPSAVPGMPNVVEGEVTELIFLGDVTEYFVNVGGVQLTVRSQRLWPDSPGRVFVELPPDACMVLAAPSDGDAAEPAANGTAAD